jgi:hypothetical protein
LFFLREASGKQMYKDVPMEFGFAKEVMLEAHNYYYPDQIRAILQPQFRVRILV